MVDGARGRRRMANTTTRTLEVERERIAERSGGPPGRGHWKDVGRNQQIRRMFICGGMSMFAETMWPSLEKMNARMFHSFSEVVTKSIPYWDKLSESDREGWTSRARSEKKLDQFIYIRKVREKERIPEKVMITCQTSDCESDPDELPGQLIETDSTVLSYAPPPVAEMEAEEEEQHLYPIQTHRTTNRADALYHWKPADRNLKYSSEKEIVFTSTRKRW